MRDMYIEVFLYDTEDGNPAVHTQVPHGVHAELDEENSNVSHLQSRFVMMLVYKLSIINFNQMAYPNKSAYIRLRNTHDQCVYDWVH